VAEAIQRDPDARCDRCGGFSPLDLGDRRLCEECYRACGSCCLEFGADDLWQQSDEESTTAVPPYGLPNAK
jgi:hypothetical protein